MRERFVPTGGLRLVLLAALLAGLGLFVACREDTIQQEAQRAVGGQAQQGISAIHEYGCYACHKIPGIREAVGVVGPPLTDWASRWYIAGILVNEPENLMQWIMTPQLIDAGVAMPNMGVLPDDARHIVAYLYSLETDRPPVSTIRGWTIENPLQDPSEGSGETPRLSY